MQWLALQFSNLPLEVYWRENKTEASAISDKQHIVCCNNIALEQGIDIGMTISAALGLQSQLDIKQQDLNKEQQLLQSLALWCYQFTPYVCVHPDYCLLLEVSCCIRMHRGLDVLLSKIEQGINDLEFQCSFALAQTPKAALVLLQAYRHNSTALLINNLNLPQQLAPCCVDHLDISDKIKHNLHDIGVHDCAALLQLPRRNLNQRFGKNFALYFDLLLGNKPDPQSYVSLPEQFHAQLHLAEDIELLQGLRFPMRRLLMQLSSYLNARQLLCVQLLWRFRHPNHGQQDVSIRLAIASKDTAIFDEFSKLKLENDFQLKAVSSIFLKVRHFSQSSAISGDLFGNEQLDLIEQAGKLINSLQARLGEQSCVGLDINQDYRPEYNWQYRPLTAIEVCKNYHNDFIENFSYALPNWLLAQPLKLKTVKKKPYWQGELTLQIGPQRIQSHWWQQQVDRDYYIAKNSIGTRCWVYQDLNQQCWYLQGIYS